MPELPEVQTIVDTIRPHLINSEILDVTIHRADVLNPPTFCWSQLVGCRFSEIGRRGKKIIFTLHTGERFVIHLGMTGRLTIEPPAKPNRPHTHLVFRVGDIEVRFSDPRRFGGVWWLGRDTSPDDRMGPEPLDLRTATLQRQLSRTRRPIKNALLDQKVIAGLGNIYVDESLHAAGIHPLTLASDLSPAAIARLNIAIKQTLQKALRHRGSTLRDYRDANGNTGSFQKLHRVYARTGQPCHTCKTKIEKIVLGGRSTHFCSKCQPPRAGVLMSMRHGIAR